MKKISLAIAIALTLSLGASQALAQKKRGPGKPTPPRTAESCKELQGDQLEACKVLGAYLDGWKEQKWAEVRKLTHPKTLELVANAKKNLGVERHRMAPWFWAKETYLLHDWKIESVEDADLGTVVFNLQEKSYRVEEDGFTEDEPSSFLTGKFGGKWYVVDRRGGGGGFDKTSITIGKKGYFDAEKEVAPAKATEEKPATTPAPWTRPE